MGTGVAKDLTMQGLCLFVRRYAWCETPLKKRPKPSHFVPFSFGKNQRVGHLYGKDVRGLRNSFFRSFAVISSSLGLFGYSARVCSLLLGLGLWQRESGPDCKVTC